MIFVLLTMCGCTPQENTDTRFLLDTVVTLTANCDDDILEEAFSLCGDFEKLLSRTVGGSDISRLNSSNEFIKVSPNTEKIIERSLYYSEKTQGKFDITVCAVSKLWDFKEEIVPDKKEISEALKNVDYDGIEISDSHINLKGREIDLGAIAKGYIADEITEYFKSEGVKSGIVNLGGNISVFGREYTVGIQSPLDEDKISAKIKLRDKSAVTSGIYQRSFTQKGEFYHHIIDTSTGFPVNNTLASVTIIGKSSMDCDALSTCCMLLGLQEGLSLIDEMQGYEAVFIEKDGKISLSKGIYMENNEILFK